MILCYLKRTIPTYSLPSRDRQARKVVVGVRSVRGVSDSVKFTAKYIMYDVLACT